MARWHFPMFMAGLLFAPTAIQAAAFPDQLLGHSVIVSWIADSRLIFEGGDHIASRHSNSELDIYISTAGRPFTKMHSAIVRGDGRGFNRESEQSPDDRRTSSGGTRIVHFEGGALLVDSPMISGARRVQITFSGGYGSCNARLIFGKEGGAPMRARGSGGRPFEVVSRQTSTPSCAIKSGNVLGD